MLEFGRYNKNVTEWDGKRNESKYNRFGLSVTQKGVVYGLDERVKCSCEMAWTHDENK